MSDNLWIYYRVVVFLVFSFPTFHISILPSAQMALAQPPYLCLFPVGDSLTNGLLEIGSYRSHLHNYLTTYAMETNALVTGHSFIGTRRYHCDIRNPLTYSYYNAYKASLDNSSATRFHANFVAPHHGVCGWTSNQLLNSLKALFSVPPKKKGTSEVHYQASLDNCMRQASKRGVTHDRPSSVLVVIMLMIGHNDVFQSARSCRFVESNSSKNATGKDCMRRRMDVYEANIRSILKLLYAEYAIHLKLPLLVLFGLNSPFVSPTHGSLLHQRIRKVAEEWEAQKLKLQLEVNDSPDTLAKRRVDLRLVAFDSMSVNLTMDLLHPTQAGGAVMAKCWEKSLLKYLQSIDWRRDDLFSDTAEEALIDTINTYKPLWALFLILLCMLFAFRQGERRFRLRLDNMFSTTRYKKECRGNKVSGSC